MELTHRFTVPAPVDVAWAAFNDLERIAPCFPGASLTSFDGDTFAGLVKVKLGPISLQYTGTGRFVERDEQAHRAVLEAKGKDRRGNGTAAAGIRAQLTASGDQATDVEVATDLNITGRPAQFGRGVMQDVSDRLLAQFASRLETELGSSQGSEQTAVAAEPNLVEAVAADSPGPETVDASTARHVSRDAGSGADAAQADPLPPTYRADATTGAHRSTAPGSPAVELDLGSTVLPVLLKRYAPHILGSVVALLVLKKLWARP